MIAAIALEFGYAVATRKLPHVNVAGPAVVDPFVSEVRRNILAEQLAALEGTRPAYRSDEEFEVMHRELSPRGRATGPA